MGDSTASDRPPHQGIPGVHDLVELDKGGFARVYAATDDLGRRVAIKVFNRPASKRDRYRIDREIRLLARFDAHPNVVNVHRRNESSEGNPYLVMELANGGTLADKCTPDEPLDWRQATSYVIEAAYAVSALHEDDEKIVHGDIKPSNILVVDGHAKLADFGISGSTLDPATQHIGSPGFSAPEVLAGRSTRDRRSDIYSLGATLYALIAGAAPAQDERDALDPIDESRCPPELMVILDECLQTDPANRPATVRQLVERLSTVDPDAPLAADREERLNWSRAKRHGHSSLTGLQSPGMIPWSTTRLRRAVRQSLAARLFAVVAGLASIVGVAPVIEGVLSDGTDIAAEQAEGTTEGSVTGPRLTEEDSGSAPLPFAWTACPSHDGGADGLMLNGHVNSVNDIAVDRTNLLAATVDEDGAVVVWDLTDGTEKLRFDGHNPAASSVAFGPDGRWVTSTGDDQTIRSWPLDAEDTVVEKTAAHSDWIWAVAYNPRQDEFATSSRDETVSFWDAETLEWVDNLEPVPTEFRDLEFHPTENLLATVGLDGSLWIWNTETRIRRGPPIDAHQGVRVNRVSFNPTGDLIATASSDGTLKVWDWAARTQVGQTMAGHVAEVWGVDFSLDGNLVVSSGSDGTVRLWDWATGLPAAPSFSADGDLENWEVQTISDTMVGYVSRSGQARLICYSRP